MATVADRYKNKRTQILSESYLKSEQIRNTYYYI